MEEEVVPLAAGEEDLTGHLTLSESGDQQEADECGGKTHILIVMLERGIIFVTAF